MSNFLCSIATSTMPVTVQKYQYSPEQQISNQQSKLIMSADIFEKTNFAWQVQQFRQQSGEWLELQQQRLFEWLGKLFGHESKRPENWLYSWLSDLFKAWPSWLTQGIELFFRIAFWLLLALLLSWIALKLLHLLSLVYHSLRSRLRHLASKTGTVSVNPSLQSWLKRSQNFYRQGNYREACRALYFAMLQRLHETGLVLQHFSRTDGEYLELTRQLPHEDSYEMLLTTHEKICFNNADISPEVFDQCQLAYREIQTDSKPDS